MSCKCQIYETKTNVKSEHLKYILNQAGNKDLTQNLHLCVNFCLSTRKRSDFALKGLTYKKKQIRNLCYLCPLDVLVFYAQLRV